MPATDPDLSHTTDAGVWTREFDRLFPTDRPDSATMLGWFANAIMAGYDSRMRREHEAAAPDPSCAECRFWCSPNPEARGRCRRKSPGYTPHVAEWPPTFASDWCGEFEPLDAGRAEPPSNLPAAEQMARDWHAAAQSIGRERDALRAHLEAIREAFHAWDRAPDPDPVGGPEFAALRLAILADVPGGPR